MTAENRSLWWALAGIALLLAATLAAYRPPAPRARDAPDGEFSAYRAKAILEDLVGNGVPHPIGSPADAQVRDAILKRLAAMGYSAELQRRPLPYPARQRRQCGCGQHRTAGRQRARGTDGVGRRPDTAAARRRVGFLRCVDA